jgi:uncharacterized RDD family membrane protein YckC
VSSNGNASKQHHVKGRRLGLPPAGQGSLAPTSRRAGAFAIDIVLSGLVATLFVRRPDLPGFASHLPGQWSLAPLFINYVLGLSLLGRSFGMALLGLRVVRVDAQVAIGPARAVARTILLMLLAPAVIVDADSRGLHDRLTSTAVVCS